MYNFIMLLSLLLIIFIPFIIKTWIKYKDNKYLVVLSIVLFVIGLAKLSNYGNVKSTTQSYCALLVMFISPALPWLVCISNNEKLHMRIAYYMIFQVLLLSYYFAYIM